MTSVNRTIESFFCPNCGLEYQGIKKPFPFERSGRFDCIVCNTEVYAWCGYYDFDHWKFTAVDGRLKQIPPARQNVVSSDKLQKPNKPSGLGDCIDDWRLNRVANIPELDRADADPSVLGGEHD